MKLKELIAAMDGLFAYDSGATDSGIHDEALRRRVITYLHSLDPKEARLVVSRAARKMWLREQALAAGYGIEDLAEWLRWLSERMDYPVT